MFLALPVVMILLLPLQKRNRNDILVVVGGGGVNDGVSKIIYATSKHNPHENLNYRPFQQFLPRNSKTAVIIRILTFIGCTNASNHNAGSD